MTFVNRIAGAAALGAGVLLGSGPISSPAQAYILTLKEVGNDVVATGTGALDLTGLTFSGASTDQSQMIPDIGTIVTGPADATPFTRYFGVTGSKNFGSGTVILANSGSGDVVGIIGTIVNPPPGVEDTLEVPNRYVSGDPLSSTSTWLDTTFATLGVTPGTYVWSWGGNEGNQNFTLIIGTVGAVLIPEPASAALLGVALAGLLLTGRIRRA